LFGFTDLIFAAASASFSLKTVQALTRFG